MSELEILCKLADEHHEVIAVEGQGKHRIIHERCPILDRYIITKFYNTVMYDRVELDWDNDGG